MKVMTPTKRLRSYMCMCQIFAGNVGIVVEWLGRYIHIWSMGCGAIEIGNGKGSSKPSYESGGGLFRDDVG